VGQVALEQNSSMRRTLKPALENNLLKPASHVLGSWYTIYKAEQFPITRVTLIPNA
jgi:hypothetical protein